MTIWELAMRSVDPVASLFFLTTEAVDRKAAKAGRGVVTDSADRGLLTGSALQVPYLPGPWVLPPGSHAMSLSVVFRSAIVCLCLAVSLAAQVTLKRGAVVFHGSSSNTSAPATIDETKVKEATKEWQKIQAEGIDPDSAQGRQLIAQMNARIRDAVRSVATSEGRDMVARKGDISDRQGREVVDLTDRVIQQL